MVQVPENVPPVVGAEDLPAQPAAAARRERRVTVAPAAPVQEEPAAAELVALAVGVDVQLAVLRGGMPATARPWRQAAPPVQRSDASTLVS
jgi:hypothetical protein